MLKNLLMRFRKMFVIGEKEVFRDYTKFLSLARAANEIIAKIFFEGVKGEMLHEQLVAIRKIEKQGDDLAFAISRKITEGAVNPNIHSSLLEAVTTADTIIDNYYNLCRELERLSNVNVGKDVAGKELASSFQVLIELADQAIDYLEKLLSSTEEEEMVAARRAIQLAEERGDDVKDEGFDKLYNLAPNIHFFHFIAYSEILHKFDGILDSCEDLADLIVSIVTAISR